MIKKTLLAALVFSAASLFSQSEEKHKEIECTECFNKINNEQIIDENNETVKAFFDLCLKYLKNEKFIQEILDKNEEFIKKIMSTPEGEAFKALVIAHNVKPTFKLGIFFEKQ